MECEKARYFFDISTADGLISDIEGLELASLADAQKEAEGSARQLLANAIISDGEPPVDIIVYDDHRQKVALVELKNLLPTSLR